MGEKVRNRGYTVRDGEARSQIGRPDQKSWGMVKDAGVQIEGSRQKLGGTKRDGGHLEVEGHREECRRAQPERQCREGTD